MLEFLSYFYPQFLQELSKEFFSECLLEQLMRCLVRNCGKNIRRKSGGILRKNPQRCIREVLRGTSKKPWEKLGHFVKSSGSNSDCSDTLLRHFNEYTVKYESTFFLGDFNTDLLKENSRQRRFNDVISSMGYVCINNEPTFFHQCGCSLLDLCLTDSPNKVIRHDQISLSGVSHHDMLFLSLEIDSIRNNSTIHYRDYVNFDALALQDAFYTINWAEYMSLNDPDSLLAFLALVALKLFVTMEFIRLFKG